VALRSSIAIQSKGSVIFTYTHSNTIL